MRAIVKIQLLEDVAARLQQRFTFGDLADYLAEYQHREKLPDTRTYNSKRAYAKDVLKEVPTLINLKIAEGLGVPVPDGHGGATLAPPHHWADVSLLRLFISQISRDKDKATRLRDCLVPYGISGFVAHLDIHPTLEWQQEIERALHCMDAFVAIHTPGFSQSIWTQQEIGFAVGRGVVMVCPTLRSGQPRRWLNKAGF